MYFNQMRKHISTYIPISIVAGLSTVGLIQTMSNQLNMHVPHTTLYALFISGFVYVIMLSNQGMMNVSFSLDNMLAKRVFASIVGMTIIGILWYNEYEYERASLWSALLSSLLYMYMVAFGPNIPPEINPLFFE
jgi:small basic protein